MIIKTSQGGHSAYNLQSYTVDTVEDIKYLPVDISMGSTAFVIENSSVYMLNGEGE